LFPGEYINVILRREVKKELVSYLKIVKQLVFEIDICVTAGENMLRFSRGLTTGTIPSQKVP
jgi:hypothetical protein